MRKIYGVIFFRRVINKYDRNRHDFGRNGIVGRHERGYPKASGSDARSVSLKTGPHWQT